MINIIKRNLFKIDLHVQIDHPINNVKNDERNRKQKARNKVDHLGVIPWRRWR